MATPPPAPYSLPARLRASVAENPSGWLIVAITFCTLALTFSARSSLGLLMTTWEAEFGWSRQFLSTGGGTVILTMMAVTALVAGALLDRYGPRLVYAGGLCFLLVAILATTTMTAQWQFILWFAVVGGVAFGAVAVPLASTTVAMFFEKNRGLATGAATSGATGGLLIVMPALAALIEATSWRTTYYVFAVVIAALIAVAWVLLGRDARRSAAAGTVRARAPVAPLKERLSAIFGNATFWLIFGGFVICGFTTVGIIEVHFLPYASFCGFTSVESASAYGVLSAANMAGMLLCGWLSDRMHRPLLLAGIYFFRALTFVILIQIPGDPALMFAFAVLFGVFNYSTMPVIASLVASHVGIRVMGLTMGLLFAGHSIGGAIGSFMGGYLFDLFQHYDWLWIAAIGLAFLAAILSIAIKETGEGATPVPAVA